MTAVEAKERDSQLMQMAEFWSARHDERRNHEWKITLAMWGTILGICVTSRGVERGSPAIWMGATAALAYCIGLFGILWANKGDQEKSWAAVSRVSEELGLACPKPPFAVALCFSYGIQVVITVTLLWACYFDVLGPAPKAP